MTITDEVAKLITERDAALARERALEDQVERQKAVLLEWRALNAQLIKEIKKAHELIGTYQTHFHTFHGSAEHLKRQEAALAAATLPEPEPEPAPKNESQVPAPPTLKSRFSKRLGRNGGDAA